MKNRISKKPLLCSLALCGILLTSCNNGYIDITKDLVECNIQKSNKTIEIDNDTKNKYNELISKYNNYSSTLGKDILQDDDNPLFSPQNLYYPLICLSKCVDTQSLIQYRKLLKIDEDDFGKFSKFLNQSSYFYDKTNDTYARSASLLINNTFGKDDHLKFNSVFKEYLNENFVGYYGDLSLFDDEVLKGLSSFISKNTNGIFSPSIDSFDKMSSFTIISTNDYKDVWVGYNSFKKEKIKFEDSKNIQKKIDCLSGTKHNFYEDSDEFKKISLSLSSGYIFECYQPKKMSLNKYLQDCNLDDLIKSPQDSGEIQYKIPMFDVKHTFDFDKYLLNHGYGDMCHPDNGFMNMFETKDNPHISISSFKQEVSLKLDDKGIFASSYAINENDVSPNPTPTPDTTILEFNEPFVYALRNPVGAITFMGSFNSIK